MKADRIAYKIGDMVYHRTEDTPGIVTGILYTDTGSEFQVCWQGRVTEFHSAIELTTERPYFTGQGDDKESS